MLRQTLKWALAALLAGQVWAAPIFVTPDGSTPDGTDLLPLGPAELSFGDSTFQQITNSSAFSTLGGPAVLTGIRFINGNAAALTPILGGTISMGTTSVSAATMSGTLSSNATGPLTLVASDYALTALAGTFDIQILFDTPYLYDPGAGNLILQFFTPGTYGIRVGSILGSSVTSGAFTSATSTDVGQTGFARLIEYTFAGPVPELDSSRAVPAFLCLGLLCLAATRRRVPVF